MMSLSSSIPVFVEGLLEEAAGCSPSIRRSWNI